MDRSAYGQGDTSSEPYGLTYQPFRLTKKDTPAPGCEYKQMLQRAIGFFLLILEDFVRNGRSLKRRDDFILRS